tara:strand:+ start:1498 stop:1689 length:192 start_codon:yes stop_codon:yes gene_type:complete
MFSVTRSNNEKYDIFKVKKVKKINRRTFGNISLFIEDDNASEKEEVYDNIYNPSDYDTLSDLD